MAVVTIARQFGAGGRTLGNRIAERLGYTLIDEQIVEHLAMEADVSSDWVNSIESEAGSGGLLSKVITKFGPFRKGYVDVAMEEKPGYIDSNLYIHLLHKILPKIANQDKVIILGRGGQYILADYPNTFHFLMIANLSRRIQFMMDNYNLTQKQAQIVVEKQSRIRKDLYKYFGREDYDRPFLYHTVFNMNLMTMEEAADMATVLVSGNQNL